MKVSLARSIALFGFAAATLVPTTSAVSITYHADSSDSFDVVIDGVGDIGISPAVFSPSGYWSFNYQVEDVGGFPNVAELHTMVRRELPAMGPFINPLFNVPTFVAYNELPASGSDTVNGDTIHATFTLNSGVALEEWDWTLRLTREGSGTSVPDDASSALLLLLAGASLGALRFWQKRTGRVA